MGYHATPNKKDQYHSGFYKLLNEKKYLTDPSRIVYRSSLELKFCNFVDRNPRVIKWGSEIVGIPYIGIDGKQHTYYVDFYVEVENENHPAGYERLLVEVKPSVETERIIKNQPPAKPKTITPKSLKSWKYGLEMHYQNCQKWKYAQEYARIKGLKFIVVTEKIINQFG